MIRITIADDHQIFRDGLRRLLETETGFEVVGEAGDGNEAIRITTETRPDVLLLDVAMPQLGGLEALPALVESAGHVILLTAAIEPDDVLRAIQIGARGVVLKESATQQLISGIHRVMEGRYLTASGTVDSLADAVKRVTPTVPQFGLTARELEIVAAVAAGAGNRDIAQQLGISLQTVKHHMTNVFDKTGASSRLELALLALRYGLAKSS